FLPMRTRVVLVGYDRAEPLDVFGPANVFSAACERAGSPVYDIIVAAIGRRAIRLTCGTSVVVRDLAEIRPRPSDTVLVAGGADAAMAAEAANTALTRWLVRAATVVRRIGSVCDGAFLLANAGIVDGHIVATHWASCDRLMQRYPAVRVDREAIFVRDRRGPAPRRGAPRAPLAPPLGWGALA